MLSVSADRNQENLCTVMLNQGNVDLTFAGDVLLGGGFSSIIVHCLNLSYFAFSLF